MDNLVNIAWPLSVSIGFIVVGNSLMLIKSGYNCLNKVKCRAKVVSYRVRLYPRKRIGHADMSGDSFH